GRRVLAAGVLVLALLALVPGMPGWPFALAALGLLLALLRAPLTPPAGLSFARAAEGALRPVSLETAREWLTLELAPDVAAQLWPRERASNALEAALNSVRERLA